MDGLLQEVYDAPPPLEVSDFSGLKAPNGDVKFSALVGSPQLLSSQMHLRHVWINGLTRDLLRIVGRLPAQVRRVTLEGYPCADFAPLSLMPLGVQQLVLKGAPKLASLKGLPRQLRVLHLLQIPHLHDLTPLSGLVSLEQLGVTGLAAGALRLPTLKPLQGLSRLHSLCLGGIHVADGSLRPLHGLQQLRRLFLDYTSFSLKEMADLARALPRVPISPTREAVGQPPCPSCDQQLLVLLGSGAKRVFLCPQCDEEVVSKHVRTFQGLLRG